MCVVVDFYIMSLTPLIIRTKLLAEMSHLEDAPWTMTTFLNMNTRLMGY